MNLIDWEDAGWLVLWLVLGLVAGVSLYLILGDMEEFKTNRQRCEHALVVASGLVACDQHPSCQLSDRETQELYVSRKQVIVSCARNTAEIMINDEHRAEEFSKGD